MSECPTCKSGACDTRSAIINGVYYSELCPRSLLSMAGNSMPSSGAAGFDRRRQYEDMAQDTVQPYNASGPNSEFYRLYPSQAEKVFTADEIRQVKKQI